MINSQLLPITEWILGAANAYILTAATPYTSYQNGELVFFVAANTNTGPSTININGLGVIPIVTITGAALGAGQIQAGIMTEMIYFNGNFQLLSIGNTFGSTVGTFGQEVPLASAATVDLGTAPAHVVQITGTTTITSLGTAASIAAPIYIVRFSSALTLTYNATSLILPGATSIVTLPGDAMMAEYLGNGNWKVLIYQSVGGQQAAKIKPADTAIVSNATLTADPDLYTTALAVGRYSFELYLDFDSVSAAAGFKFTQGGTFVDSRGLMPALASGWVNAAAYGPKADTFYGTTVTYSTVSTTVNGNQVLYKGSVLVGTPGTFGINWAQATSTASSTTLRAGSYLVLSLLNTGASSNLVQHIYSSAMTAVETIPVGYNTLTVESFGASGAGGIRYISGPVISGGGGGGSGGYSISNISVTGLGGDTLNFTVGTAGVIGLSNGTASTVSSGTLAITTMTANGGINGAAATSGTMAGAGGTGGTATGGTVQNISGNTGQPGLDDSGGQHGGSGGFGIPGINSGGVQGGHGGGYPITTAKNGGDGIIVFSYS